MAPHSSTLAWKIPWTEEPGRLQSMGLRRVGHDWATSLSLFTFMHWRRKWEPTPVFLPGESNGWRSLAGYSPWDHKSRTWLSDYTTTTTLLWDQTTTVNFLIGFEKNIRTAKFNINSKVDSSTGGGNGNPFQYLCLENPVDRGAWQATVHRVAKSQTQLSTHTYSHTIIY